MNIELIQEIIQKFSDDRGWNKYHSPKNLTMALSGETGELVEIFQWLTEEESFKLDDKQKIKAQDEIADIAIYLLKLSKSLDINLEEAILEKMKKNEEKYPIELVKDHFKKYTEL